MTTTQQQPLIGTGFDDFYDINVTSFISQASIQHQQLQQISKQSNDQSKVVSLTKSSSSSAQILISAPESTSNGQPKHEHQVIERPFHKCQWAMCDRVFVGLENLRKHALDVHVGGFDEEDGEDSGEVAVKRPKEDEQSIEQVNRMNPIASSLDKIVSDSQSCATSHDHAYDHQIDHLPSAPLNESASLICSFAECVDLTFNHLSSLLRHTRLKHSQSLHPIHCKPFTNVRRSAQSNHVLKIVVTDKMACSLCDKWFRWQDDLEMHVIQKHTVRMVVTAGFGGWTNNLESDEKLETHLEVCQEPEHHVIELSIDSNSNKESLIEMNCDEEELQQSEQQVNKLNESANDRSFKSVQHSVFDNTSRCDAYCNEESLKGIDSVSEFDNQLLGKIDSNESDSEEGNLHPQQLEAQQKTNETNNDNNDQDCLDYLVGFQIDSHGVSNNCDYQDCEDTVEVINDNQQLQYAIVDDNGLNRLNINRHQQQNQDQFIREFDQSSLNSTQPLNQPNSIIAQSNVHLNEPNPPTHLSTQQKVFVPDKSTGKHVCEVCGKKFKVPFNLVIHIRMHTGEKPLSCTWKDCGKAFSQSAHLKGHLRTHTREKPFACNWKDCEKIFSKSDHLKNHIQTHTGEKPFICPWKDCHKSFARMRAMQVHHMAHSVELPADLGDNTRMHTKKRQLSDCPKEDCDKTFVSKNGLKRHLNESQACKSRNNSKQHLSEYCGKTFKTSSNLAVHTRTHTGEKPFKCCWKDCDKTFSRKYSLKTHFIRHSIKSIRRETIPNEMSNLDLVGTQTSQQQQQISINLNSNFAQQNFMIQQEEFVDLQNLIENQPNRILEELIQQSELNVTRHNDSTNDNSLKSYQLPELNKPNNESKSFISVVDTRYDDNCNEVLLKVLDSSKIAVERLVESLNEFNEHSLDSNLHSQIPKFQPQKYQILTELNPEEDSDDHLLEESRKNSQVVVSDQSTGKHICKVCGKKFKIHYNFVIHNRIHSGVNLFKCTWKDCGKAFVRHDHLKVHMRTHTGVKPFSCTWEDCGKSFAQHGNLKIHLRTHTRKKLFICPWKDCHRTFAHKRTMKVHHMAHSGVNLFKCTWKDCGKAFAQHGNLKIHLRSHTREKHFTCPWKDCHKSFASKRTMQVHHMAHSVELPADLSCNLHTKERLLLDCPKIDCGKTFVTKNGLKKHLVEFHAGKLRSNSKQHLCEYCDKTFKASTHLTEHIRTHTGEKPLKCSWKDCDRAFNRKSTLKYHFIRHSIKSIQRETIPNEMSNLDFDGTLSSQQQQQEQQISINLNSNFVQPNFMIPCKEHDQQNLTGNDPNTISDESILTLMENLSPLSPVDDPLSILMHNLDPMMLDQSNLDTIMGSSMDLLFDESEFEKHFQSLIDS